MRYSNAFLAGVAAVVLTGCFGGADDGDPKSKAPGVGDDAWCTVVMVPHLADRDFERVEDIAFVDSDDDERTCSYTGVVSESKKVTEVATMSVTWTFVDGEWVAGEDEVYVPEVEGTEPIETDRSESESAVADSASMIAATAYGAPKKAPKSLEAAVKHKPFKKVLSNYGTELDQYVFNSATNFEVCVVHESGAWGLATPSETTWGAEGGECQPQKK